MLQSLPSILSCDITHNFPENIPPFKTVYPTLEECCQVSFGSDICPSDDECENVPTVEPTRSNWSWSEKPTARPTTKLPTRLPTRMPTREPTFKVSEDLYICDHKSFIGQNLVWGIQIVLGGLCICNFRLGLIGVWRVGWL